MKDKDGMIPAILALPTLLCKYFNACGRYPGPTEFTNPMENITAVRGSDVTFVCEVKHLGRHRVAWVKTDPMKLLAYQNSIFRSKHKYRVHQKNGNEKWILTIRNVQAQDAGGYMCQINTNPMIAQIAYLNLKMPPAINRLASSEDTTVREGDNVTLTCAAEGTPEPMMSWRRMDMDVITLVPNQGGPSVVRGAKLNIQKVSRKHMAEYLCVAMNGIEPDDVYHVKLHVKFPPTLLPYPSKYMSVPLGGTAELKCRVESWPRPDNIQWTFKGALVTTDSNKFSMQRISDQCKKMKSSSACPLSVGTLQIKNVKVQDLGSYSCEASNDEGKQSATIVLQEKNTGTVGHYNIHSSRDYGSGFNIDDEDYDVGSGRGVDLNLVSESGDMNNEVPISDDSGADNNNRLSSSGDSSPNAVPNTDKDSNGADTMPNRTVSQLVFFLVSLEAFLSILRVRL